MSSWNLLYPLSMGRQFLLLRAGFMWERDHLRIFPTVTWKTLTGPLIVPMGEILTVSKLFMWTFLGLYISHPFSYRALIFSPACHYWCSCSTEAQNFLICARQNCSYCSGRYLAAAPIAPLDSGFHARLSWSGPTVGEAPLPPAHFLWKFKWNAPTIIRNIWIFYNIL